MPKKTTCEALLLGGAAEARRRALRALYKPCTGYLLWRPKSLIYSCRRTAGARFPLLWPCLGAPGGTRAALRHLAAPHGAGPGESRGGTPLKAPHAARGPGCPWARGPCCPRGSAPKGSFPCLNSWCPRLPAQPESSREGSGQLPVPGRWLQSRSPRLWFPSRPAQAASRGAASAGTWGRVFGKGSWTCDRWSETPPCRGRLTGLWTPLPARAPGSRCKVWLWSRLLPEEPGAPFSWPCSCAEPRRHFAVGQGLG